MDSELKFLPRDCAKAYAIARTQERGRIFCRIKELERRSPDQIPATWRTQRINSCLRAADSNGAGRNFFSRHVPPRRRQFLWQARQKRKARNEANAGHSIFSRAMQVDDLLAWDFRTARDVIHIESELGIVTNWNLDYASNAF